MATNAQVDTLAAAVPAPFGPLTRLTNMATLPTPNEDHNIEFNTSVTGVKVWMSYNELNKPAVRNRILSQLGMNAAVDRLIKWLDWADTYAGGLALPHNYDDWKTLYNTYIRDKRNPFRGRL